LSTRIALLATQAKNILSCPHIWFLEKSLKCGDLFVVKDHANISTTSPGIGPNLDFLGQRFYDISHLHNMLITEKLMNLISAKSINYSFGDVFWINNSSIPDIRTFS